MRITTALISVSDKTGLDDLAAELDAMGVQVVSTGGTAAFLQKAGITVIPVSERTGFPEILDGRVKTLHPRIHAGILARAEEPAHQEALREHEIEPIQLVVVNLYPFARTVAQPGVSREEAVEQIDIGGPTLIRAAAKNSDSVTVVVDPADYPRLIAEMKAGHGEVPASIRRELATKAFRHTAEYDAQIAAHFEREQGKEGDDLASHVSLGLKKSRNLRYGENPHQRAAVYVSGGPKGLVAAKQHQGKELSFNNFVDMDAAWKLCLEFDQTACCIIKHNNPCGTAFGVNPAAAFAKALECDPVSAFGSVISFNRRLDEEAAIALGELFVEVVIAPEFDSKALDVFSGKKNLRVVEMPTQETDLQTLDVRSIAGGYLVQDSDLFYLKKSDLKSVTGKKPTTEEVRDLLFAWTVCKHVKSNAIVIARDEQTVGIGAGQMSRVDSVELAIRKAKSSLVGTVLASDAFFPFPDSVEVAARAGVTSLIQPGGSIRDDEVIEAANSHGMSMVFTGIRHFRH